MRMTFSMSLLLVLAVSGFAVAEGPADDILGQWYTKDDASKVNVVKRNGKYYGTIIWLAEPDYEKDDPTDAGKPKRDRKNRDDKLRHRPIIGLQVLKNFAYDAGDKTWESGTIYDPDVGKTYKCVMRFQNDPEAEGGRSLQVKGYIGVSYFGRTTVWYRVPNDELEEIE